jgi:hypothetical protein
MTKTRLKESEVVAKNLNTSELFGTGNTVNITNSQLQFNGDGGSDCCNVLVRAGAISNVATLSGTYTLSGVALAVDDLVALTAQTDPKQNGVWLVKAGSWVRADIALYGGLIIIVVEGTRKGDIYRVDTEEIVIGTTDIIIKPVVDFRVNFVGGSVYSSNNGVAFEDTATVDFTWGGSDASGRTIVRANASSGLPSGATSNTLYYNGTAWVASTTLLHNGTNAAIGTAINSSVRLYAFNAHDTAFMAETEDGLALSAYASAGGEPFTSQADGGGAGMRAFADLGPGGVIKSITGVGCIVKQEGDISTTSANNVLLIDRNVTLVGAGDCTASVLKINDPSAASGKVMEAVKQGVVHFFIDNSRTHIGRKIQYGFDELTLTGNPYNNDVAINKSLNMITVNSGGIITGISGGGNGDGIIIIAATNSITVEHDNSLSAAGNRIHTDGFTRTFRRAEFIYLSPYWYLISRQS